MKIYQYREKNNLSGTRIREARVVKRISQSDLAARLQVEGIILERDSISRIENGSRFVADYELKTFAKILNVDIEWLLEKGGSFLLPKLSTRYITLKTHDSAFQK